MNRQPRADSQIRQDIKAARAQRNQLQAGTKHSWNVYRRLKCLGLIQQHLQQTNENPGQLANFNATIAGYTASPGEIQLTWKSWAVSYWIQGVKHNERHFDWEDCMEREAQANALDQSMWIGGAGRAGLIPLRAFYASPPPAVDSTLDFTLNLVFRVPGATGKHVPMKFGSGAPLDLTQVKPPTGTDPGYFFLSQLTGRGTPEFACKPRRTTILLYHAVLGQIETSAGSRAPELGYSVFHCGDGWLKVYRAVALEVIFSNADPEDMEVTWDAFRCAISPDLGQDGLRLLYSTDDMEVCRGIIALGLRTIRRSLLRMGNGITSEFSSDLLLGSFMNL